MRKRKTSRKPYPHCEGCQWKKRRCDFGSYPKMVRFFRFCTVNIIDKCKFKDVCDLDCLKCFYNDFKEEDIPK